MATRCAVRHPWFQRQVLRILALATGLLGAFWGAIYLRRRSAIAPMVSHAGFDLLQILQFLLARGAQVAFGRLA